MNTLQLSAGGFDEMTFDEALLFNGGTSQPNPFLEGIKEGVKEYLKDFTYGFIGGFLNGLFNQPNDCCHKK
ncbi:hypothetical protein [Spirosoma sp.]|uniref:hypothetical protein n=1 Tax=Spirosoma sp. TaxID=1899569 RepID=UPI002617CF2D|nr:hypothetical protein [Spirosoma sp.]MCX6214935.1 hypothetical protein [Spirosoma sp.]